ncbi:hypothetical protein N6H14_08795 [Paenibacillus sp. CC-CFT747]|nr:hypothetical protein N6H14_08795 [Paenibacillus sp. CC-CFT747]
MDTIMTLTRNHWHQLMSNCYLTIHEYCRDRDLKAAMMKKPTSTSSKLITSSRFIRTFTRFPDRLSLSDRETGFLAWKQDHPEGPVALSVDGKEGAKGLMPYP